MGYLYVFKEAGNDNFYKVGITKNDLTIRQRQLQTGNPRKLVLVKAYRLKNYKTIEGKVHRKLERYGTDGGKEWFATDKGTIINVIESELKEEVTLMESLGSIIGWVWSMFLWIVFIVVGYDLLFNGGQILTGLLYWIF